MSNVLDGYRQAQAAAAAGGPNTSYYLKKEQRELKEFKPGKTGVMNEKFRFVLNPVQVAARIAAGKDPYFDLYYAHEFTSNGRTYMTPCPAKNAGEPCKACEREGVLKQQGFDRLKMLKQTLSNEDAKKDPECKAFFKQANLYGTRTFYVVRGINRANQANGVRYWFIKESYVKKGIWDQLGPQIDLMVQSGLDIADPAQGRDLNLVIADLDKFDGSGTYKGVTGMSFDPVPTPLALSQDEVNRLVNDSLEWKQLREPLAVRGWLTPSEFIEEAINNRMPYWDTNVKVGDYNGAWIITPPGGQPFVATYENSPEKRNQAAKSITESDLQATHLGVNPTQPVYQAAAPHPQPAYQAPAPQTQQPAYAPAPQQQPTYAPAPQQQPTYAPAPQQPIAYAQQQPVYAPAPQQQPQYAAQPPAYAPAQGQPPVYTPTPAPMPAAAAAAYQAPAPAPPTGSNFSYNNPDQDDLPF